MRERLAVYCVECRDKIVALPGPQGPKPRPLCSRCGDLFAEVADLCFACAQDEVREHPDR